MADEEVTWSSPLYVTSASPTAWLSGIAGIGTAAAALVANSDLIKRVLGSEPAPQLTLMVVGGLIAVALVALSGVITSIPLKSATLGDVAQTVVEIRQFTLGAILTTTGVGVQLWAIGIGLHRLDLPVSSWFVTIVCVLAGLVLVGYLWKSVDYYIQAYAPKPADPPPKPSPELIAEVASGLAAHYLPTGPPSPGQVEAWLHAARTTANEVVAGPVVPVAPSPPPPPPMTEGGGGGEIEAAAPVVVVPVVVAAAAPVAMAMAPPFRLRITRNLI